MKTIDICNPIDQRIVARLVEREVLCCVSYLISRLCELEPDNDELIDLVERRDYETPLEDVTDEQWQELAQNNDLFGEEGTPKEVCLRKLGEEECCDQLGLDPCYTEVYEHWLVTDWIADKLREKGQIVNDDLHGLTVWGRCCTGQAISMDWVFWEIAFDMGILSGMENSWEEKR